MVDQEHLIEVFNMLAVGHALEKHNLQDANERIAPWLSAALEDPQVCEEMKNDIRFWFDAQSGVVNTSKQFQADVEKFKK